MAEWAVTFDPETGIAVITLEGVMDPNVLLAAVAEVLRVAGDRPVHGALWDFRSASQSGLDYEGLLRIWAEKPPPAVKTHLRVAALGGRVADSMVLKLWEEIPSGETNIERRVFTNREEAWRWLIRADETKA